MSRQVIPASLRRQVRQRPAECCEYCRIPQLAVFFPHEVDHVIAEQHGGEATWENLALACLQCNRAKGPNLSSIDPETRQIVTLFNPRTDTWSELFRSDGGGNIPLTAIGRATARLLNFGDPEREQARVNLSRADRFRS